MVPVAWLAATACAHASSEEHPTELSRSGERDVPPRPAPRRTDSGPKRWVTWRDWAIPAPPSNPNRYCLAEIGCSPGAPAIPPCPQGVESIGIAELETRVAEDSLPHEVSVRGRLRGSSRGMTTLLECRRSDGRRACCNHTSSGLVLEDEAGQVLLVERGVLTAFRCGGDDSIQCCGFAGIPGIEVVARGIVEASDQHLTGVRLELDSVRLCALPDR